MRRILDIGHTDFRLFFKRKTAYIWLFAIPTMMIYFLGLAVRDNGGPSDRRPKIMIDNKDPGFLSRVFLDEMNAEGMDVVSPTNADAARGVRIPADFTARILRGRPVKAEFFEREGSGEADAALGQLRVARALIAINGHLLEAIAGADGLTNVTEARLRERMAAPNPVTLDAHFAGRKPAPSGFGFSLPGNLVMYVLMNVMLFGATSLVANRRNGVIRRLMISPASRLEIILGKIYGNLLLGLAQIVYLLVLGKFAFHLNLGANLPGVLLLLLAFAWGAAALGVFVGSCIVADDRVVAICVLTSLMMGALGGSWWPLELAPPAMQKIALCLPTGWALSGLHQLISFGSGFGAVLAPLAALLVFGAVVTALAIRFFRV